MLMAGGQNNPFNAPGRLKLNDPEKREGNPFHYESFGKADANVVAN